MCASYQLWESCCIPGTHAIDSQCRSQEDQLQSVFTYSGLTNPIKIPQKPAPAESTHSGGQHLQKNLRAVDGQIVQLFSLIDLDISAPHTGGFNCISLRRFTSMEWKWSSHGAGGGNAKLARGVPTL